jgi:formylglycine-generating enzyme required for sulfatase activity
MGAIFISYTSRDPQGPTLAVLVGEWLREWGYESIFRDQDLKEGIPAASDWRRLLHGRLAQCQVVIAVCSECFQQSQWCTAEVAVAMDRGKPIFPLQLGETPLPLLLQNVQAIAIEAPIVMAPQPEAEAKERLRLGLERRLSWRDKLALPRWEVGPFPGLEPYDEQHAALFFGRDAELARVLEEVRALRGGSDLLLLLGASGCGKSSLLRAGVVPELRRMAGEGLLLLDPFRPDREPMQTLATQLGRAMAAAGLSSSFSAEGTVGQLLVDARSWRLATNRPDARLVLPIDQLEDVFNAGAGEQGGEAAGDRFLAFLARLLCHPAGRVLVVATLRTDFLALLEGHPSHGAGLCWQPFQLEPMAPSMYGEVIDGPCRRLPLQLESGLKQQLVADTGSGDALPLLAFTLQALWAKAIQRRDRQGKPEPDGVIDFRWTDYNQDIGTVETSVQKAAKRVENSCTAEQLAALEEAFVGHLLRLSDEGDGRVAKQRAPLARLPAASQEVVRRMIDRERLLVSDAGEVEIAHEALLRTWDTLKQWIVKSHEGMLQRRRARRLGEDLKAEGAELRRQALEQLAALAAAGGSEERTVQMEAAEPLAALLTRADRPLAEREDAALVLALIGAEETLRACLGDLTAPVALRRRAAESLGLLARRLGLQAKRSGTADPWAIQQRQRIADELEYWLRSDALNLLVRDAKSWAEHDARLPLLQGASRGLQLAASAELPLFGSGPGLVVPMLTLTALEEGDGLRIVTEVVEVPVWQLPLPAGEQLELVLVPGPAEDYQIGSPKTEAGRDFYRKFRQKCERVDVEALRSVRLRLFALVRQPISQGQWRAVVEAVAAGERELEAAPGKASPESLWERHGQPGELAVDSVSWNDSQEWLRRLNRWLNENWQALGGSGEVSQLALPSESQWEVACRGDAKPPTPFHFGATLDGSWARYDASYTYGRGRKGAKFKQPWTNGSSGLVNRWGLAELHGQLFEWCADLWNRDPRSAIQRPRGLFGGNRNAEAAPIAAGPVDQLDPALKGNQEQRYLLLRGGSWFINPRNARAAFRLSSSPDNVFTSIGLRPCCPSPPGSLLGP